MAAAFLDEEPGEVIESAPPLRVGEERVIDSASGLRKKLLKSGRGWVTPVFGDEATIDYVGMLRDGTKFDSTRDNGEPLTFKLGHELVNGLDDGISTMTKGELVLFTLPSASWYGDSCALWLTLVDVFKVGGIIKKILVPGDDVQTGDLDEVQGK